MKINDRELSIAFDAEIPLDWCNCSASEAYKTAVETEDSGPYTQKYVRRLINEKIDDTATLLGQSGYIGRKAAELKEVIDTHNRTLTLDRQQTFLPR